MIEIELRVPPSINSYYGRRKNGGVYIKADGVKYRQDVALIVRHAGIEPLEGDLIMEIDFYPPDRRRHDWDNILKCLCDSLESDDKRQYRGAYHNDDQIYKGTVEKFKPVKGGKIVVRVWTGCKSESPAKI